MIPGALALIPFIVAAVMLATCRPCSRSRLLQAGSVFAVGLCAAFLVAGRTIGVAPRVVFVLDSSPREYAELRTDLATVLGKAGGGRSFPFRVRIAAGDSTRAEPAADAFRDAPRVRTRVKWRRFSGSLSDQFPEDINSPDQILVEALHDLSDLSVWQRLDDLVRLRQRRLLVGISQHGDRSPWVGTAIPVAALARTTIEHGITVDVVHLKAPPVEPPRLDIECDPYRVPSNALTRHQTFGFRLRFSSGELGKFAGQTAQCDLVCGIHTTGSDSAELALKDDHARLGEQKITPSGTVEVLIPYYDGTDCWFSAPQNGSTIIPPGFNLVKATMTVSIGTSRLRQTASTSTYLHARRQEMLIVKGTGDRFGSASARALESRISSDSELWPVAFGRPLLVLSTGLRDALAATPALVVAHDLAASEWESCGGLLEGYVRDGGHLLLCGVPVPDRARGGTNWLPATARVAEVDPQRAALADRRPCLTIMRDASRLGKLEYYDHPREPEAPPDVVRGDLAQNWITEEACKKLELRLPDGPASDRNVRFATAQRPQANPHGRDTPDAFTILTMQMNSALAGRLRDVPVAESPTTHEPDRVILAFFYDVPQAEGEKTALDELLKALRKGWIVAPILLDSPFCENLCKGDRLSARLDKIKKDLTRRSEASGVLGKVDLSRRLLWDPTKQWVNLRQGQQQVEKDCRAVASYLAKQLEEWVRPRAGFMVRHGEGRFFDERFGARCPPAEPAGATGRYDERWAAPLRFQPLDPRSAPSAWRSAVYASVLGGDPLGLPAIPVAVGGVFGKGTVLCLGYSPFEPPVSSSGQPDERDRIQNAPGESDHWGLQRLRDYGTLVVGLDPPAVRGSSRVIRATAMDPPGRVRFEVVRALADDDEEVLPTLRLRLPDSSGLLRNLVDLNPVDCDALRTRVAYDLLPSMLGGGPQAGGIVVASFEAVSGVETLVVLDRPAVGRALPDLSCLTAMGVLARYSGGAEYLAKDDVTLLRQSLRVPAGLLLVLSLAGVWAARALSRLRLWRDQRIETSQRGRAMQRFDEGAILAAGEALGRPQANLRVGAFAGYRPLEPGDRLENAVREDVILLTACRRPIIPRVGLRVDERLRRLHLVVQLGNSMRRPGSRREVPPKIAAAARVAGLLGAEAIRRQGEVVVHPVGLRGTITPRVQTGGQGKDIHEWLVSTACRPGVWYPHDLPVPEEPGSVIYISDFLMEDLPPLFQWAERTEAETGPAGAVAVFCSTEFLYVDVGVARTPGAKGTWGLVDRSEWLPEDLRLAYSRLHLRAADGFHHRTTGGLVVTGSHWSDSDCVAAFAEARLLEVLR